MEVLEYLVATMQALLGPLPVTDQALRQQPESYLSWLHLVLTDFQAAQDTPYAPKTVQYAAPNRPSHQFHQDQHDFIAQVSNVGNNKHEDKLYV